MKSLLSVGCLALALVSLAIAGEPVIPVFQLKPGQLETAPSFEACSYYFRPTDVAGRGYAVEFRRTGDTAWQRAFEPVCDQPVGIWKGSLFNLTEDTDWQVRVLSSSGAEIIGPQGFHTWSSHPPIARIIDLSQLAPGPKGWVISDQGQPDGWIKYTAPAGWKLECAYDAKDLSGAAITFSGASHVILENITVVGGARYGILVENSESVRILNCEVTGWGRVGVQQFTNTGARGKYADAAGELINLDGGITITRSARTVVERCYVHDPRHRANSWMYSHPAGPSAVFVNFARGGTVLRWNDFVGSDEHRWNDVVESASNSAPDGGFFRDSDISGNFLAFGNDDGIELEGGGMNVRFYRNKIEGTTCGISTGPCFVGPQFVYGNLVANPGDEAGLALMFFKNSHRAEQGGKRHFVNNTLYGLNCSAYGSYGRPTGSGRLGYMRNNVFVGNAARLPGDWARREDFDGDLFWLEGSVEASRSFLNGLLKVGQEMQGAAGDPHFVAPEEGDFHLGADSPARQRALAVANLTVAGAHLGALADDATEVPFRPLALTATPRQLDFSAPEKNARMQVTLRVPAGAKEAVPFVIRKNRVATWFDVSPATGTVAPGETVTLTVTVDPAALRGRPRFKGAFLVRTPSGLSRPVSVYAAVDFHEDLRPASAPDTVYLDAVTLADGKRRLSDAGAPVGGKYLALNAGDASVAARFVLPRGGRYALLARAGIGREVMKKRNFALTLDGAMKPANVPLNTDYEWNTGATNVRVVFLHDLGELAPGDHELRLQLTGGEIGLHELIITDNPAAFFADTWQREKK
ncbi:right-handed parallel beta-helix repeat-containing protein [Horticoccus luteus]|uniref:Right-handed parallel beta-helix repeat-containing protein n=1 Tax=Horticoccus luteus TaxID=2862869 RepID=A0A8F9TUZ7_9BACT|nr:right-handed parallel beta-helix repeat-containing protein [Horticoccus luteus]QYM78567.1 right-handed parallel beta-helix repeat-containing protein [Horticoccus luteus]